jgi:hypothetical protein
MEVVAESSLFHPDPETFESLLQSLDIVECAICGCHLFRYVRKTGEIHVKGHWVADELTAYPRWDRFNKKMYLCEKCAGVISGTVNVNNLRKSIEQLSRRVDNLERRVRRARKLKG